MPEAIIEELVIVIGEIALHISGAYEATRLDSTQMIINFWRQFLKQKLITLFRWTIIYFLLSTITALKY